MVSECGATFAAETTEGQSMSAKHDAKTRKVYNARQVVKHFVMPFTKARRHRSLCTEFGRTRRCQKVDRVRHGRQGPRMFCFAQNSGHQVIKLTIDPTGAIQRNPGRYRGGSAQFCDGIAHEPGGVVVRRMSGPTQCQE